MPFSRLIPIQEKAERLLNSFFFHIPEISMLFEIEELFGVPLTEVRGQLSISDQLSRLMLVISYG